MLWIIMKFEIIDEAIKGTQSYDIHWIKIRFLFDLDWKIDLKLDCNDSANINHLSMWERMARTCIYRFTEKNHVVNEYTSFSFQLRVYRVIMSEIRSSDVLQTRYAFIF